jgi:FMN phosphatase YigB (HAD superfamily)
MEASAGNSTGAVPVALFDLDNTLFDRVATYRVWATYFVQKAGLDPAEVDWLCFFDGDGFTDRGKVWAAAKVRFGLSGTVEELIASYRRDYLDCCRPDIEVHHALATLRDAGWRIGIVTNGPMPQQSDKAVRLGLLPLVDGFCASGELGIEKPDRRIFDEAIRRCATSFPSCEVDAHWMVGDAGMADVAGARAVGLRSIWIHRGRTWNPADGAAPDVTCGSVADAVAKILVSDQ